MLVVADSLGCSDTLRRPAYIQTTNPAANYVPPPTTVGCAAHHPVHRRNSRSERMGLGISLTAPPPRNKTRYTPTLSPAFIRSVLRPLQPTAVANRPFQFLHLRCQRAMQDSRIRYTCPPTKRNSLIPRATLFPGCGISAMAPRRRTNIRITPSPARVTTVFH